VDLGRQELDWIYKLEPTTYRDVPAVKSKSNKNHLINLNGRKNMRLHTRYHEIIEECRELSETKNEDYAKEVDPLWNLRMCENAGVESWVGVVIRLCDKFSRLLLFTKKRTLKVKDEGIVDTLKDIVNYCIFCIIFFEEWQEKQKRVAEGNSTDNQQ
tara:strand:+ start:377 stop:847 length:471 start_codon:yes stop_codon:yes gene_type:complete